nr:unnamed protein product [Callosobruchus analis]
MIPFKGTLSIKQYIKSKPSPWGIKSFLLCGSSGLVYDFVVYQGKTTPLNGEEVANYGIAGGVVLKLCERIPSDQNYKLFADNFFTCIPVIKELREKKIWYTGTIRKNRTMKCILSITNKSKRGTISEVVNLNGDIVVTQWSDNNIVTLASSLIGKGTVDLAQRWSKTEKKYISVERPEVIKIYNESMGGVDKTDFLIQLYRIFIRSRKWTLRVIFHFVTMSITNSWLEYRQDAKLRNIPKKENLDLLSFTFSIAKSLAKCDRDVISRKRGRPSSADCTPQPFKKKLKIDVRPQTDIRYDAVGHWPVMDLKPQRCKKELCQSRSRVKCEKCNVHLCMTSANNCFKTFHIK